MDYAYLLCVGTPGQLCSPQEVWEESQYEYAYYRRQGIFASRTPYVHGNWPYKSCIMIESSTYVESVHVLSHI